jgi:hypothetical protein
VNPAASQQEALKLLIAEEREKLEAASSRLEETRLDFSKLKLRYAIFGKGDLSKTELQLRSKTFPKQIAKLEKKITRHQQRLEMLTVYKADDQGEE